LSPARRRSPDGKVGEGDGRERLPRGDDANGGGGGRRRRRRRSSFLRSSSFAPRCDAPPGHAAPGGGEVGEVLDPTGRIESPSAADTAAFALFLFPSTSFVCIEGGRVVVLASLQGGRGGAGLVVVVVIIGARAAGHPRREDEGSPSSFLRHLEAQQRGCDTSDARSRGRYRPRRRRGRSGGLGGQHPGFVFFFSSSFACAGGRRRHRRRRRGRPPLLLLLLVVFGSNLPPSSPPPVGGEVGYRPLPPDALAGRVRRGGGPPPPPRCRSTIEGRSTQWNERLIRSNSRCMVRRSGVRRLASRAGPFRRAVCFSAAVYY